MNEQLYSDEAERTVIGQMLISAQTYLPDLMASLSPEDFHHPAHAKIFAAAMALDKSNKPVDPVAISGVLVDDAGIFQQLGGMEKYFSELIGGILTCENTAYHAQTVRKKALRRKWIAALAEAVQRGNGGGYDDDGFFESTESLLLELSHHKRGSELQRIVPVLRLVTDDIGKRYETRNNGPTGITTGTESLDYLTSGLQPGELIILAARPSMGKTAYALNIVSAASATNVPVLVFSLEMSTQSLVERLVAAEGRINSRALRTGDLKTVDWLHTTAATTRLADRKIWFCDEGGISISRVRSLARRWRTWDAKDGPGLVVVDYLQLLSGEKRSKNSNREQEISEISRGLKALAKELRCPVVALSQLNRGLESRADKRPMLSDLRESGAIEQDADIVAFLYRGHVYDESQPESEAELIVAKNRNGACGMVELHWEPEYTRFSEAS